MRNCYSRCCLRLCCDFEGEMLVMKNEVLEPLQKLLGERPSHQLRRGGSALLARRMQTGTG